MKKDYLIPLILIFLLVIPVAFIAVNRAKETNQKNMELSLIKEFVKNEPYANLLNEGKSGITDCYPENQEKVFCNSMVYDVSFEKCLEAEKHYINVDNKRECGPVTRENSYQGNKMKVYFGAGPSQEEYVVQVWVE